MAEAALAVHIGDVGSGADPEQPLIPAPVQIAVCTGHACRTRWNSPSLLEALRTAAAAEGRDLRVTPCRCLDLCKEGPVVLASPAHGASASTGAPSGRLFVNVEKRDMQDIIDAVGNRKQ